MNTALLSFRNVSESGACDAESRLVKIFSVGGVNIDRIEIFSAKDDVGFKNRLAELSETADALIILSGEELFDVKDCICKQFGLQPEENANAAGFVGEYNLRTGASGNGDCAMLPEGSVVIPSFRTAFQGFMTEGDDCLITVLPCDPEAFGPMCAAYVLPYFLEKFGNVKAGTELLTFKLFGADDGRIESALAEAIDAAEGKITFSTYRRNGDVRLDATCASKGDAQLVLKAVAAGLKDRLYAEEDVTLEKRLFDLLSLHRLKIGVAESFTAGRIAAAIISVPGASAVVNEGVVAYSNHAKTRRLGVSERTLTERGAVSKETAYEMAAGLLLDEATDAAIATTGIAGPQSDGTGAPVGLCYVAVGGREGVHIHRLNLRGDRETITETAKNNALFLAIKHINEMF